MRQDKLIKESFDKEQADIFIKTYWKKGYKKSEVYKMLDKLKTHKPPTKFKKRYYLVLWLFYQHSFQSIISDEKGNIKENFNKEESRELCENMLKYYKLHWGKETYENVFPQLAKAFVNEDLGEFKRRYPEAETFQVGDANQVNLQRLRKNSQIPTKQQNQSFQKTKRRIPRPSLMRRF